MKFKLLNLILLFLVNFLFVYDINAQNQTYSEENSEDINSFECIDGYCILCFLTRDFENTEIKAFIDNFGLVEGFMPGIMENDELGISIIGSDGIGIIEIQPDKFEGELPLIGAANTPGNLLKERYPDNLEEYDNLKFIYESMILVSLYYSADFTTITQVQYSPLDFIQFYDDCFEKGINSQLAYNDNALWKLSVIPYLENLFVLSGYGFQDFDPQQLGYFSNGKVKDNVFALKMYEGLNEQDIDYVFNEIKSVIEAVDFDVKILFSSYGDNKIQIDDDMKSLIIELTGIPSFDATEFSYSSTVYETLSFYSAYEDNSINLLINQSENRLYDLILVVINE